MKRTILAAVCFLLVWGCAPYKQLNPKPELTPEERGFIKITDNKNEFVVKQGKMYYMEFPAPPQDNFYLVISMEGRRNLGAFLTKSYEKNIIGEKIKDETIDPEKMSVYAIHKSTGNYYWMIDRVDRVEMKLKLYYRYTPQWRFKFENKYENYKKTVKDNVTSREIYRTLGTSYHFQGFGFKNIIEQIKKRSENLNGVQKELLDIESIFPPDIKNSKDRAYLNYVSLKEKVEDEIKFQSDYLAVLNFFYHEDAAKGNTADLLNKMDEFIKFFSEKSRFPAPIVTEAKTVIGPRLKEILPFYKQLISGKEDAAPFDPDLYRLGPLEKTGKLHEVSGIPAPRVYQDLTAFVKQFNEKAAAADSIAKQTDAAVQSVQSLADMPSDVFFRDVRILISGLLGKIPATIGDEAGEYKGYKSTTALNEKIQGLGVKLSDLTEKYRTAEILVPKLNEHKARRDYSGLIGLLKQYLHLDFLVDKYRKADSLSIVEQTRGINTAITAANWWDTERKLKALYSDRNFLDPEKTKPVQLRVVKNWEDSLKYRINTISRSRVLKFLEENIDSLHNVDSMYMDSVFFPVHEMTFTVGSPSELERNNQELRAYLQNIKEFEFPAKAITRLYDEFMKNPNDNGVLKARAIVAHGKQYKGDDDKIRRRLAECDPWTPKWIVKPKQYRRVFALPVTDSKTGQNRYVVRMKIKIPSEAKFPVYDVNIKLPKTVARNAAAKQWYEKILMNGKKLKNEGRFTISAPTASNGYECQITPVRMRKDKSNTLEIYFNHKSFKVLPISVMVQKPIIKKN